MSKRRKILLGLVLTVSIFVIVAVPAAYYFGLTYGWNFAVNRAKEYGVQLTKKDLSVRWQGGLRFVLSGQDLGLRFEEGGPLPLRGTVVIPRLHIDASFDRARNLITVEQLEILGINGSLVVDLPADAATAPPPVETKPFQIPDLYALKFEIPRLPVGIQVAKLSVESSQLQVQMNKKPTTYNLRWDALKISGGGKIIESDVEGGIQIHLVNSKVSGNGILVEGLATDLQVQGVTVGANEKSISVRVVGENDLRFTTARYETVGPKPLVIAATKGHAFSKLSEKGPEFLFEIEKISGVPGVQREVSLRAEVQPKMLSPETMRIDFKMNSQGLVDGAGELTAPRSVDKIAAQAKGKLKVTVQSALMVLFMKDWPRELNGPIALTVQADRSGEVIREATLQVTSKWLNAELNGQGNPELQTGDAGGFVGVRFPDKGVTFFGQKLAGSARVPFKALFRGSKRIFIEGMPEVQNFTFRSPHFSLVDLSGQMFVSQSWSLTNEGWKISPVLEWNPFNRVDLDSTEALDSDQKILTAQKILFQGLELGPLRLSASFRQNLLFIPSWSLQCPTGRFQGVLLSDLQLDRPRIGMGVNAIEVDMSKVLPQTLLQGRRIQSDPTSFTLSMDWDLMKASAAGSFDWIQMTPGQVYNALDFLDPLAEKPAFNTVRSLLNKAYPTRVLMSLRGAVADIHVSTNIIQVPSINNVAISPYLVKFREDLYQTEFIKGLKTQTR